MDDVAASMAAFVFGGLEDAAEAVPVLPAVEGMLRNEIEII